MKIVKRIATVLSMMVVLAVVGRTVEIYLTLSNHGQRTEIGLAGFMPLSQTVDEARAAREIGEVLRFDLLFSRYFNLVEDGPLYSGKDEELLAWADRGAGMIICGTVRLRGSEVVLTGRLLDVGSKQAVWEKTYIGGVKESRRMAHELNDDLLERITGERGIAHSKIVFVNNRTRAKELYVVDYDGANLQHLTLDNSINILPRWSPKGDEVVYTTYRYGNPDLYAISFPGSYTRPVSRVQGLNTAANYSPDGQNIVLTISQGEYPNLYLLTRGGKIVRRLTNGRWIDTSPCFAPNGREIVYVSDRPGIPQLFIMNLEGGNQRRLSARGYCDSPAWSPRGDKIAFSMRQGRDNNDIFVYDLEKDSITRLTQDEGSNENPSWSPDGRFLVFSSSRSGRKELFTIAVDGSGQRRLGDIPGASATPSWSP